MHSLVQLHNNVSAESLYNATGTRKLAKLHLRLDLIEN